MNLNSTARLCENSTCINLVLNYMLHHYSSYEIKVLKQLAAYRNIFAENSHLVKSTNKPVTQSDSNLSKQIEKFTELFCAHNFADTNYSIIQSDQYVFESPDTWINSMSLETIFQCLTYVIWTDRSIRGYFVKKINDHFLEKILTRLDTMLEEFEKEKLPESEVLRGGKG